MAVRPRGCRRHLVLKVREEREASHKIPMNQKLTGVPESDKKVVRGGRLAQLDRALASGAKGRGFDPRIAHHLLDG